MKGQYKILKKLPILLPFFWIFRLIKLILLRTKDTFRRLFQLNKATKDIEEIKDIYKNLGL
jgi:hypothetical protein